MNCDSRNRPATRSVKLVLLALIITNTVAFLTLAVIGTLNVDGKAMVYVDFWGRVTVYSLWFICYAVFQRWVHPVPLLRWIVVSLVLANIPTFLLAPHPA